MFESKLLTRTVLSKNRGDRSFTCEKKAQKNAIHKLDTISERIRSLCKSHVVFFMKNIFWRLNSDVIVDALVELLVEADTAH